MTFFLVVGGVGIVLLLIALVLGDIFGGHELGILDSDVFSTAAVAGFLGAFGFGGAATLSIVGVTFIAVLVGIALGLAFGWGAVKLTRAFKSAEKSDAFSTNQLIGADAVVITDIPADGYGEIRLSARGHVTKLNARAETPIPAGSRVWVSGVLTATAVEVTLTFPEIEA